jgi:hypothetical protein
MLFWISLAALLVGAGLFYIDEVSFHDETLIDAHRRRMGVGLVGAVVGALGVAGILLG